MQLAMDLFENVDDDVPNTRHISKSHLDGREGLATPPDVLFYI